jgi:RNA polymerase sigma-70 factor (ECF subfamily)
MLPEVPVGRNEATRLAIARVDRALQCDGTSARAPAAARDDHSPDSSQASPSALDPESRDWWVRLHGTEPVRERAIAELHERLRREAAFHLQQRTRWLSGFPRSDLDDLAVQAADDALLAILRKLDDYRGESPFWAWARRFAQLEAPVSIRRRLGHERVANEPDLTDGLPDPGCSLQESAELQELLRRVYDLVVNGLTPRQRFVLTAVAIDGASPATVAMELETTPGAVYKTLHDARRNLTAHLLGR